jgi:hypothetical protein
MRKTYEAWIDEQEQCITFGISTTSNGIARMADSDQSQSYYTALRRIRPKRLVRFTTSRWDGNHSFPWGMPHSAQTVAGLFTIRMAAANARTAALLDEGA